MARERLRIDGDTPEEKFKSVERVLRRMQRRSQKKVVGIIPPIPIFGYVSYIADVGEVVLRYMFPSDGVINGGFLALDELTDKTFLAFQFTLKRGDRTTGWSMTMSKLGAYPVEDEMKVEAGDRLTVEVSAQGMNEPNVMFGKGVWVSLLYKVKQSEAEIRQIVLDELLEDLEKEEDEGV